MKLITKPERWQCMSAAFAMAADMTHDQMIADIGHDGSEIISQVNPEPLNRRGFHPQEFVSLILSKGHSVTMFEATPTIRYFGGLTNTLEMRRQMEVLVYAGRGVLCGKTRTGTGHAVAFNQGGIFDPDGSQYAFHECDIDPFAVYVLDWGRDEVTHAVREQSKGMSFEPGSVVVGPAYSKPTAHQDVHQDEPDVQPSKGRLRVTGDGCTT